METILVIVGFGLAVAIVGYFVEIRPNQKKSPKLL
jgi:hypothetical protein